MSQFNNQFLDVIVDSINPAHYLGIECKSFSPPETKVYFSKFSVTKKGEHQVTRISKFIKDTGRFGVLAIELRGSGRGPILNTIFLVPWHHVEAWYNAGQKSIDPTWLSENGYPVLKKVDGVLNWEWAMWQLRQL
jgi:Holliday junction resolvase